MLCTKSPWASRSCSFLISSTSWLGLCRFLFPATSWLGLLCSIVILNPRTSRFGCFQFKIYKQLLHNIAHYIERFWHIEELGGMKHLLMTASTYHWYLERYISVAKDDVPFIWKMPRYLFPWPSGDYAFLWYFYCQLLQDTYLVEFETPGNLLILMHPIFLSICPCHLLCKNKQYLKIFAALLHQGSRNWF